MISRQYVAGFFDGEGCVNISVRGKNTQVCLRVMIVNTDAEILMEIYRCFGGRLAKPHVYRTGWKAFRQLVFSGKEAFEFLLSIAPFVIVKKRQVRLAIDFWNFQRLPKSERCDVIRSHQGNFRGQRIFMQRKPETIKKELWFKNQMHILNKKGTTAVQ